MNTIADNLVHIHKMIITAAERYARNPATIKLLAVSKAQPISAVAIAYQAGQKAFGENYTQEALNKIEALADRDIEWHFIGHIQKNKTAIIAKHFDWVHSLENIQQAKRLNDQRSDTQPLLNVLIQVNLDEEDSKSGIRLEDLPAMAKAMLALPRLKLRGLMTIPAPRSEFTEQRLVFAKLQQAFRALQSDGITLDTLSMGMTQDYTAAIAEGATILRLGTAIFGERRT